MRVTVSGLEVYGYHGVSEEERRIGHRLIIDLELDVRSQAEQSDRVGDTVDYGAVSLLAKQVAEESQFHTLERLAQEIGRKLLGEHERIQRVSVSVNKPYPPFAATVETVGVTLELSR